MTQEEFLAEWNNSDTKILVHTSGSTGKPKPMWVEKKRMLNSARITCDFLGLKPGDTALLCMPLDYIAGKMMVVRGIERNLRLISVKPSNHPLSSLPPTPNHKGGEEITFAAMVPSQVFCSLQVPEERERLLKIKNLIIGGGAISKELQDALNLPRPLPRRGEQLQVTNNDVTSSPPWEGSGEVVGEAYSTYGMTETLSHIALRKLTGPDASEWYTPFDSVNISQDEDGCLIIDAPLVHEGELHTNDIVEIHTDGRRFRIKGRKDNVICCGGIKLQIEEMEDAIRPFMHAPFAITKKPDEKFGEVAVLLMEQEDMPDLHPDNPYFMPKEIRHVDKIELTETGKIKRGPLPALPEGKVSISHNNNLN